MSGTEVYPPVTAELLDEVVRRVLSAGSPRKIILFGSHARGDAHPYSDLDLLIVEDSDEPRGTRGSKYWSALSGIYPEKDILVWTPEEIEEWSEVRNAFATVAVREGRTLFSSSTPRSTCKKGKRPIRTKFDLARGWMTKGDSDLTGARMLIKGPGPYDTACFHAQQAVEKHLKAVIALAEVTIARTHDLSDLQAVRASLAPTLDLGGIDLKSLNSFAVKARYDQNYWPEREEAEGALAMAERLRAAVLAVLPAEAHPAPTSQGIISMDRNNPT